MKINWEGKSIGRIVQNGIKKTQNGFLTFYGTVECTETQMVREEGTAENWQKLETPHSVDFYLMLTGSKGVNAFTRQGLVDACGWDGKSLAYLEGDLSKHQVQITHGFELDNKGKNRLRVQWLNPVGTVVKKNPPEEIVSLQGLFDDVLKMIPSVTIPKAQTTDSEIPF